MLTLRVIAITMLVALGISLIICDYANAEAVTRKEIDTGQIGIDILALMVLAGVGAFGGYLSAIQNEFLKPADPRESSRAFRRAILQGAAGAIIIVTLAPIDPNIVNGLFVTTTDHPHVLIKLIALGVIGGYAGGALLESSAQQFAKKINDVEEKQKTIEDNQKKDAETINLVEEALHGLAIDFEKLKKAMQQTTSVTRSEIFNRADDNRRENWLTNKEAMERSLPVFRVLTATDEARVCHWWYGSLAYCLKDKREPDYEEALYFLDKAIVGRGNNIRSGSYEFNRAICKIHLSAKHPHKTWDAEIEDDLEAAKRFRKFAEIMKNDFTVKNWLRQTGSDQASLSDRPKST